jgi:hypothetical protein
MEIGDTDTNIAHQQEEAERIGVLCFYFLASPGEIFRLSHSHFPGLDGMIAILGIPL